MQPSETVQRTLQRLGGEKNRLVKEQGKSGQGKQGGPAGRKKRSWEDAPVAAGGAEGGVEEALTAVKKAIDEVSEGANWLTQASFYGT